MKKIFGAGLFAFALAATSTVASATSACSSSPATNLIENASGTGVVPMGIANPTNPVSQSCTIGSLLFSNFSYNLNSGSFANTPPDISVELAVVGTGSNGVPVGVADLEFNPDIATGSDLQFEFQVSTVGGGTLSGIQLGYPGSGTGVSETVCMNFTLTGICAEGQTLASISVTPTTTIASANFAPQSSIWVYKDIQTGTGFFSEVNQGYVVPEPMTFSLLGAGLLGLGLMGRRRSSK